MASRIPDLGQNLEKLPDLLIEYEEELELLPARIGVKGKTAQQALKDQMEWPVYYDQKRVELRTLNKYMERRLKALQGRLFQQSVENYSREISDKAREKYIDNVPEYNAMCELCLEVEEVYEKYLSAAEAFKVRGFALRDHTQLLINSLQDVIL